MLPVEFSDGSQALVAGAGNAIYANKAIEMILMRVKDKELTDYQTLPDCAQSVIKEIKGHIRESAGPATFNELQQLYADYSFQQRHTWWRKLKK